MDNISVVVLTKNEEKNIIDCLESLSGFGQIIIIDDYSTDRTVEIVESLGRKEITIYKHHLDSNFSEQRNFGLSKVKNNWVLFVDADERLSSNLLHEISEFKVEDAKFNAFSIKREDVMWGKRLLHGETGNIWLVRFANKKAGKWIGKVHETWQIKGKIGRFKSEILHYPHPSISDFLSEINFYSSLRAGELFSEKVNVSLWQIIGYPKAKFIQNYVLKQGFLDGIPGLVVATMMSLHSFLVRGKLWLMYRNK